MLTRILTASVGTANALLGTAAGLAGLTRPAHEEEAQPRPERDHMVMHRYPEHGDEPLCGCAIHDFDTGELPVFDSDFSTEEWDIEPLAEPQLPRRERWRHASQRSLPWIGGAAVVCGMALSGVALTADPVAASPTSPAPVTHTLTAEPVTQVAKAEPVTVTVTPDPVTVTVPVPMPVTVPVPVPVDPFDD